MHNVITIDREPGNGTRYRLFMVVGPAGTIDCIAWPDMRWSAGWFGHYVPGADWLEHSGGLSRGDAVALVPILAAALAEAKSCT